MKPASELTRPEVEAAILNLRELQTEVNRILGKRGKDKTEPITLEESRVWGDVVDFLDRARYKLLYIRDGEVSKEMKG